MEIRTRFGKFETAKCGRPWTKEEILQGFVVDVGDLTKLVMAKSGIRHVEDVDRKLAHELADCLWCVLVLARMYHVDIQQEFMATMDGLDAWIGEKLKEPNLEGRMTRGPSLNPD
jgi:hypothetical protein